MILEKYRIPRFLMKGYHQSSIDTFRIHSFDIKKIREMVTKANE